MNSRDRVLLTVEHKEPDRVPLDLGGWVTSIHKVAYEELLKYLGFNIKPRIIDKVQQIVLLDERVLKAFEIDTRHVYPGVLGAPVKEFPDGSYVDMWGVKRVPMGYYYDMPRDGHPLENINSIDELEEYEWPDPHETASEALNNIEPEVKRLHEETDYAVVLDTVAAFFEPSWYMRGFERFMVDLSRNREFACKIMDKILDFQIKFHEEVLSAIGDYVDILTMADDLALQNGPLISPKVYKELVKPRQKKLVRVLKSKAPHAKILYHCCGSALHFYNDLAEIGIDIVNPVQVSAAGMDTHYLKSKFGDKLCFWGAIDTQRVLPRGKPEDVEKEVKKRIKDLAPGGGYVLCAVHNIQPDVPPQNIVRMYKAALKYGKYPISLS